MNLKAKFQKKKAALYEAYLMKVAGLALFVAANPILSFASKDGIEDTANVDQWPWTKFLNSLADQLTGPLPTTLGVLGLAAAAIAMFTGNQVHHPHLRRIYLLVRTELHQHHQRQCRRGHYFRPALKERSCSHG